MHERFGMREFETQAGPSRVPEYTDCRCCIAIAGSLDDNVSKGAREWTMQMLVRFFIWIAASAASLSIDIVTKAAPHNLVINHYARISPLELLVVSLLLCGLALFHSNMLSVGCGLMFGGLCGNCGQLLLYGYASDWLPVGGWLTNIADIAGAVGLVWCFVSYLLLHRWAIRFR